MKAEWGIVPMGKLCSISSGESDTQDAVPDGPYAFFDRSKTIKRSSRFLYDCEALIIPGEGKEFLPKHFKGKFDLHQRAYALFEFVPELDVRFLFHLLHHRADYFPSVAVGATVKSLRRRHFDNLPVPLPSLPEQQRIVAILDEAFAGIATARAAAEQNRQNARDLFESHLQSVFSQRGEGWVEKPLCEVSTILNGYAFKSGDFSSDGATKSIKITNVGVREFVETSDSGLPADFAEQFASVAAPARSLVIALTRTIIADGLKVAVVPPAYDRALVNQRVAALLPKPEEVSASYLFAYLSTSIVLNYVKERVNTLMQPNLSINDLRTMPIPLPPASERESIIDRLNALEEETQRLEALYQRKLEALDELKQSLLHQAFSGQL